MFGFLFAFVGDLAQADVLELGPGEANRDHSEERDEQEAGGAGSGRLRRGAKSGGSALITDSLGSRAAFVHTAKVSTAASLVLTA